MSEKSQIDKLEAILNSEPEPGVYITPDGFVRRASQDEEISSLRHRVAVMEEALKPFSAILTDPNLDESLSVSEVLTVADFRRARKALEGEQAE